jgi:hypothetical protein
MGAVAWAMRRRSVSHPRSSNRTCGFPASGSVRPWVDVATAATRRQRLPRNRGAPGRSRFAAGIGGQKSKRQRGCATARGPTRRVFSLAKFYGGKSRVYSVKSGFRGYFFQDPQRFFEHRRVRALRGPPRRARSSSQAPCRRAGSEGHHPHKGANKARRLASRLEMARPRLRRPRSEDSHSGDAPGVALEGGGAHLRDRGAQSDQGVASVVEEA